MNELLNVIITAIKYNKKKIIIKKSLKNIFVCNKLINANIIKNFEYKNKKILITLNFLRNKQILPMYGLLKEIFKLK